MLTYDIEKAIKNSPSIATDYVLYFVGQQADTLRLSIIPSPLHSSLSWLVEERSPKSRSASSALRQPQNLVLTDNSPLVLPSTRKRISFQFP